MITPARDRPASLDEETISSTDTIVSRVRRRVSDAQHLLSVITITGIRDHHRLERLITIPGMRILRSGNVAAAVIGRAVQHQQDVLSGKPARQYL